MIRQDAWNALGQPDHFVRYAVDGVWTPWEYVNPPMQLGVEYRTTERWQEAPVYAKLVNFGAAPNSASSSIAHNIENFQQCAGLHGTLGGANLIGHSGVVSIDVNAKTITIETNRDLSKSSVLVLIRYTKTTD